MLTALSKYLLRFMLMPLLGLTLLHAQPSSPALSQEKLFVHTDRSFYMVGEIIWFKPYLVDEDLSPVNSSSVLYTELVNPKGKVVAHSMSALDSNKGGNSLYIPLNAGSGNYVIRFYTRWMRNFGPEAYFSQPLTIVNPFKKLGQVKQASAKEKIEVSFFPEGGELIQGLKSNVGVKVNDVRGNALSFSGFVINSQSDTVTRFSSFKFGMGHFNFIPKATEEYMAFVEVNDSVQRVALPEIRSNGLVLSLEKSEENLKVIYVKTNDFHAPDLRMEVSGREYLKSQQLGITADSGGVIIPLEDLSGGVSAFTIFRGNKPLAERIYFKKPTNKISDLRAYTDQREFETRSPVNVQFENPEKGHFSMAVFNQDDLARFEHDDILSYFWMGSQIKGHIQKPGYYFGSGDSVEQATENLMLCQGWRRFKRPDIHNRYLPEYEAHIMEVKVTKSSGQAVKDLRLYLSVPGNKFNFYTSTTDSTGVAHFITKGFLSKRDVVITTDNPADNGKYKFEFLNPFDARSKNELPALYMTEEERAAIEKRSLNMQITNVYSKDQIQNFKPSTDSLYFFGTPDKTYYLDDYTRFPTIREIMVEFITEVQFRDKKEGYYMRVYEEAYDRFYSLPPLVLLDGVPVHDLNLLEKVNPLQLQKVDLLTRKFVMGSTFFNGIISYTSYSDEQSLIPDDEIATQQEIEGLTPQREFYSPNYSQENNPRLPDFRTVLYWNPDVSPSSEKNIQFFTGDNAGNYVGILQGITANGAIGLSRFKFKVNDTSQAP